MNTAVKEKNLEKILNGNFQYFFVAIILAILAIFALGSNQSIDPLLGVSILTVGILILFKILEKSVKLPLIPSIFLQLIVIAMFFDKNITAITGLNLKLYAIVFGMAAIVAFFCIIKDFKQLWKNFPLFRYLFLFFLINVVYSVFYHSDFRSWFSDYLNILYYGKSSVARYFSILNQEGGLSQEFTESKLGIYLFGLVPIVSTTLSLLAFKGLGTLDKVKERLNDVIKYISLAFSGHFILVALTFLVGLSSFVVGDQGRIDVTFLGIAGEIDLYLSLFFIVFVGYFFISNVNSLNKDLKLTNVIIPLILAIMASLILLSINKTCIISLVAALSIFGLMTVKAGASPKNLSFKNPKLIIISLSAIVLFALVLMTNPGFLDSIEKRFSTVDSLLSRGALWKGFIDDWFYNMNIFTFIFGNGIDSSRELAFYVSTMIGENNSGIAQPHIHNMFLQMFYEYGVLALLYIGALLSIVFNSLKNLVTHNIINEIKLISILSITLIFFFFLYHMSYVVRIPGQIIFFSILGFLEAAKYSLLSFKPIMKLDY